VRTTGIGLKSIEAVIEIERHRHVVFSQRDIGAAKHSPTLRFGAGKTIEQVINRAVFLDDHKDLRDRDDREPSPGAVRARVLRHRITRVYGGEG
jgi:hypothetical protein